MDGLGRIGVPWSTRAVAMPLSILTVKSALDHAFLRRVYVDDAAPEVDEDVDTSRR